MAETLQRLLSSCEYFKAVDIDSFTVASIYYCTNGNKDKPKAAVTLDKAIERICTEVASAFPLCNSITRKVRESDEYLMIDRDSNTELISTSRSSVNLLRAYHYVKFYKEIIRNEQVGKDEADIPALLHRHFAKFNDKIAILLSKIVQ